MESRSLEDDLFGRRTKRKTINQNAKGSGAELDVAKHLMHWSGLEFNRVPKSGGLRWGQAQKVVGDVICSSESYYPFINEVKFHKRIVITPILRPDAGVFVYWRQVVNDCIRVGRRFPLLFCRDNGMGKVAYPDKPRKKLYDFYLFVQPVISKLLIEKYKLTRISTGVSLDGYNISGFMLSEFIAKVSFNDFISDVRPIEAVIFG